MRLKGLYGIGRKALIWAIFGCLAACFGLVSVQSVFAEDRKTRIIPFESGAAHTAGTEYSSGFLVEKYSEGLLLVNFSAKSGTPTVDLTIETSDDNSTYYYHSALSQVSETGTTGYKLTNFGKYMRIKQLISGTTSFTYDIKGVFKN